LNALKPILLLWVVLCALSAAVWGQEVRRDFVEQERIRELEALIPEGQPLQLTYGGWFRSSYFWFDDPPTYRGLRTQDLRIWGAATLDDVHHLYARGRLTLIDWNTGDAYNGNDADWEGMNLDSAFYRVEFSRALERYFNVDLPVDVEVRAGRQFMQLGSGLVYSQINDGFEITTQGRGWKFLLLGAQTVRTQDNIDNSIPGSSHSNRKFLGWQLDLTSIGRHSPYLFMLFERDRSKESPNNTTQDFDYDANYLGFGSRGELLTFGDHHMVRYWGEGVYQWGYSFTNASETDTEPIEAFALDAGVELLLNVHGKPRLVAEYAIGSGDNDRLSVTNSIGGNRRGTDRSFLYFGYLHTGYSLAPRLSNLQMVRVGAAARPFEKMDCVDRLEFGTDLYWYWKDKPNGAIQDLRATLDSKYIGSEFDMFVNWQILSDLVLTIRQGWFYPRDSYLEGGSRAFFSCDVTYSF